MTPDLLEQFREAMRAAGLIPPAEIVTDSKLHRFASNGERGDDAGWYVFHNNGIPAGAFGDWRTGMSQTWRADVGRNLTPAEEATHRATVERMWKQREADDAKAQEGTANRAMAIWSVSRPAPGDHAYLVRKGIKPNGARVLDGQLVIPMRDASGRLWNVERIASVKPADGTDKKGLYRGRRIGCFFFIGTTEGATALCIAEGFATGATIHEATGHPVAVAFNCGNLLSVAIALHAKFPDLTLIVCVDDDYGTEGNPGLTKATQAAQAIGGLLAVPDFGGNRPEGATDFNDLAQHAGPEAVKRAVENAGTPDVVEDQAAAPTATAAPTSTAKGTVAQVLIEIGARGDLFHDERGDGYVVTTDNGVRRTLRLCGREFRRWIRGRYYAETGKAANGEAIAAALGVLEAKATFGGRRLTLFNRFAEQDGAVFIDLCDEHWRAVKITAEGWRVVDKPPILFRRHGHQLALPEPQRGSDLVALWPFLNLRNQDERHLIEAWLSTVPFSTAPRPALMLHGPQGAAKTTLARALKSLLDPSATDTIDLGRDPAALAQVLDHNAVPVFDNVTGISTWAGDMLCKAVTGGGFTKRELYTDAEDVILAFKRALIVTGINIPTHAPDLLDRMILVELERIAPENRRGEREFWTEFDAARPRLFGAILDAISGVLRYRDQVSLVRLPRMADFARLACAYAEHSAIGADKMMNIIMDNADRQTQEVIESDPLATAVLDFTRTRRYWNGTATELLVVLNEPYSHAKTLPESWPRSAKSLGKRLKVVQTTLAEVGVVITWKPSSDGKSRRIELAEKSAEQTSETSETPGSSPGAGSGTDVSPASAPPNVGETSTAKPTTGAASGMTDISDMNPRDSALLVPDAVAYRRASRGG